jgi:hypothetical protein
MEKVPNGPYNVERLPAGELQIARVQNNLESDRLAPTHVYIVEDTKKWDESMQISYGARCLQLPLSASDMIKPGTKVVVIQQSEDPLSPVDGVYVLGENLMERKE